MTGKTRIGIALTLLLCVLCVLSCSKKEEEEGEAQQQLGLEGGISDEVNFGVYFDEAGEQRTLTLDEGQEEFKVYIIVRFPEWMEIAAVEWRLELPEGIEIVNDQFHPKRFMLLGTFEAGISERFACMTGPSVTIHTLTLKTTGKLRNAEVAILPGKESKFLGVAKCQESFPLVRAASYKGVVNPE
jgi:hypothetical protein